MAKEAECTSAELAVEGDKVLVPETLVRYNPHPRGLMRECSQWDERGHRFLVSIFEGGMGAVAYQPGAHHLVQEQVLVNHPPRPGLSNLGFRIDYSRNRVVSCASDKAGYLLSTVVAYDYTTWDTLWVVELASGAESKSLADDLTIDPEGDMYVTDTYNGLIWKVKSDGSEFHVFSNSPLYQLDPVDEFFAWVKLNGIVYHPHGFLLVTHLGSHALFKVSCKDGNDVRMLAGFHGISLLGDGIVLVNNNKLAMAGMDLGTHLLETTDDWETAAVTHHCPAPDAYSTAVSLKGGCVFNNYVNKSALGAPPSLWTPSYTCIIGQPIFKPIPPIPCREIRTDPNHSKVFPPARGGGH